jgi:hypothetical protein
MVTKRSHMDWRSPVFCTGLLAAVICTALPAYAQDSGGASGDGRFQRRAIAGIPTSAIHCLSENAANIHNLGWIDAGSHYVITFDSDFDLVASFVRFDLGQNRASVVDGSPEFNGTASNSGEMVLHVTSTGDQDGCYQYSVVIDAPAATASEVGAGLRADGKTLEGRGMGDIGPLAISGTPSSAQHCVGGNSVPNVHEIGRIDRDSQVTISFDADFDALAGMTRITLDPVSGAGGHFVVDDNSGGGRNPALNFTANAGDNVVLYVTGTNGATGCYRYKVEIR